MTGPEHTAVHHLTGAYVLGAVDDEERAAFEAHLSACPDCQAEVVSLREGAAALGASAEATPPPHLRDAVLAGIRTRPQLPPLVEQHAEPLAPVVPLAARRRRRSRLAAAAVAAVIALGGGAVAVDQLREPAQQQTPSARDRLLAAEDLQKVSVDLDSGATVTVARSRSRGEAMVMTTDMPAAPEHHVYEVWLLDAAGEMKPAGLMARHGDQDVMLTGDVAGAHAVGITVEPDGGSPQPTTDPLATIDLRRGDA